MFMIPILASPRIELSEFIKAFLGFSIIIVDKLWVIQWNIWKCMAMILISVYRIHIKSVYFEALFIVAYNPNTRWWRNADCFSNCWKHMIIDENCAVWHMIFLWRILFNWCFRLYFLVDCFSWTLIPKNIIFLRAWLLFLLFGFTSAKIIILEVQIIISLVHSFWDNS